MDLLDAGKQVFVISGLVVFQDQNDKTVALARIQAAGAAIVTIEMVLGGLEIE